MGLKNIQFGGSNLLVEDFTTALPCGNRAACLTKSTVGRFYGNRSFASQSPCLPISGRRKLARDGLATMAAVGGEVA